MTRQNVLKQIKKTIAGKGGIQTVHCHHFARMYIVTLLYGSCQFILCASIGNVAYVAHHIQDVDIHTLQSINMCTAYWFLKCKTK